MTMPSDPNQQQPYQQQPYPQQPPPPPQVVYVQQPAPQVMRSRASGGAHTVHLVLTVCTCGLWAPVWFLHWLFARKKTVIR